MTELVSPKLFLTVDPPVGLTDFTLSAWVKLPHRMQGRACLLRKPLATQRALSCWGWFHPAQFVRGPSFERLRTSSLDAPLATLKP